MTKGRKRYANMEKGGNWFAHADVEQTEKTREVCTSTGSMLAQGGCQLTPLTERYPKIKSEKTTMGRNYPFSEHDNRATLEDNIETYNRTLGRKKCLDDRRQHISHFCLCHDGNICTVELEKKDHSVYHTDFAPKQSTDSREDRNRRRFARNHLEQSRQAAMVQAGEHCIWFGRHDLDHHVPLNVLAASNLSPSS